MVTATWIHRKDNHVEDCFPAKIQQYTFEYIWIRKVVFQSFWKKNKPTQLRKTLIKSYSKRWFTGPLNLRLEDLTSRVDLWLGQFSSFWTRAESNPGALGDIWKKVKDSFVFPCFLLMFVFFICKFIIIYIFFYHYKILLQPTIQIARRQESPTGEEIA